MRPGRPGRIRDAVGLRCGSCDVVLRPCRPARGPRIAVATSGIAGGSRLLRGWNRRPDAIGIGRAPGRALETPVALIRWGTTAAQDTITGTLADIVEKSAGLRPPVVAVIGGGVSLRERLRWFKAPPPVREPGAATREEAALALTPACSCPGSAVRRRGPGVWRDRFPFPRDGFLACSRA